MNVSDLANFHLVVPALGLDGYPIVFENRHLSLGTFRNCPAHGTRRKRHQVPTVQQNIEHSTALVQIFQSLKSQLHKISSTFFLTRSVRILGDTVL